MLNVDEAIETILQHTRVLNAERVPLLQGSGQVAAEEVMATINVPDWDSSAVDGYAVKASDIHGANPQNPRFLRIVETVKAGTAAKNPIQSGIAIRIMTGAPIPAGAECVVKFEDTDHRIRIQNNPERVPEVIGIGQDLESGDNIRRAGENVPAGVRIIDKDTVIGPADVNLLASQGYNSVKVIRQPKVAVIATGEELIPQSGHLSGPKIFNGNSYNIGAQVLRCGGIPKLLGIARDNRSSLISKIRRGMQEDMVITTGGVSRGDYDLVKNVMAELGEMVFWQVGMMPGKPFAFGLLHQTTACGRIRKIPHLALTGNPTASMINFEILARPAILKMAGRKDLTPKTVEACLEDPLENSSGFHRYVWVKLDQREGVWYARSSAMLTPGILPSIALSNGLAVLPPGTLRLEMGNKVSVILLNWR